MKIGLVLGKMLCEDGSMCQEYKEQMAKAVGLLESGKIDSLIISGGVTRAAYLSEARTAYDLMPPELQEKVVLEEESRSTTENIREVRKMLEPYDYDIESLTVITGSDHAWRTGHIINHSWPEIASRTSYDSIKTIGVKEHLIHLVLYILTWVDPDDGFFVPLIKKFRNG